MNDEFHLDALLAGSWYYGSWLAVRWSHCRPQSYYSNLTSQNIYWKTIYGTRHYCETAHPTIMKPV